MRALVKYISIPFFLCGMIFSGFLFSQTNPEYVKKLESMYKGTVPLIQPSELKDLRASGEKIYVFDTRTRDEYDVSHLKGAYFLDYDHFKKDLVEDVEREHTIIVYCTVGYRSERLGEKLKKLGFEDVRNLYGGIVEWSNQGGELIDHNGQPTQDVHVYSAEWGRWLEKGNKVYK